MLIVFSFIFLFFTIIASFLAISTTSLSSALHPDELSALEKIATTLGIKGLNLSYGDPCSLGTLKMIHQVAVVSNPEIRNSTIRCNCTFNNSRTCHITNIELKTLSLPGRLPPELAELRYLQSIYLYASGLKGPIPDEFARLEKLAELFVSDTTGINAFPNISRSKDIKTLILRNVGLSGLIPPYIWDMPDLKLLDLSFNNLTGDVHRGRAPTYTYLTGNRLSGNVGSGVFLNSESNIDLSYNNFSWSSSCEEKRYQHEILVDRIRLLTIVNNHFATHVEVSFC